MNVPGNVGDEVCVVVPCESGVRNAFKVGYKASPLGVIVVGQAVDDEVEGGLGVLGEMFPEFEAAGVGHLFRWSGESEGQWNYHYVSSCNLRSGFREGKLGGTL